MIRFLRSGLPWAVLVLAIGLARQHASGAGIVEAAEGLVAKARATFAQLEAELIPAAEPATAPTVEEVSPAPIAPQRFTPQPLPVYRGCRH